MADLDTRIRELVGELVSSAPSPPALDAPSRPALRHRGTGAAVTTVAVAAAAGVAFVSVHLTRHPSANVKVGAPGPAGEHLTASFPSPSPLTVVQSGTYEGKPWKLQVEVNGPGPVFRQNADPTKTYISRMQLPGLCLEVTSSGRTDSACTNPVTDPALTWMTQWAPFRGQRQTEVVYGLVPETVSAVQLHLPDQVLTVQTVSDAHTSGIRFFATFFPMQRPVTVDGLNRNGQAISTSSSPFYPRSAAQVALSSQLDPLWPPPSRTFATPQAVLRDFSTAALGINSNAITLTHISDPYYGAAGRYTAKIAIPASDSQLTADVIPTGQASWVITAVNDIADTHSGDGLYQLPNVATNLDGATGKVDITFRVVPDATTAHITYNTAHGVVSRALTAAELRSGYTASPAERVGNVLIIFKNSQGQTVTAYGTNGGAAAIDPTQGAYIGTP